MNKFIFKKIKIIDHWEFCNQNNPFITINNIDNGFSGVYF